jgi:hypothetical protein
MFRRIFRQVWPELGWPRCRAEMIRQSGAAYSGQEDTRLGSSAHWCLRCNRNEVLIEVAPIDVLAALARPFQRYPGIFSCTHAVEFCPEIIGLRAPH